MPDTTIPNGHLGWNDKPRTRRCTEHGHRTVTAMKRDEDGELIDVMDCGHVREVDCPL
jgi:hypothetical protein